MKLDAGGTDGLPLAEVDSLVPYTSLVFGGWDLNGDDLAKAAHGHRVLDDRQVEAAGASLAAITPWPAAADPEYCRNAVGANVVPVSGLRARVDRIREDIERFREQEDLDRVVVVNLASTERWPDLTSASLQTPEAFEDALDAGRPPGEPGHALRLRRDRLRLPVRELHPERVGRRAGPAHPLRAARRAGGRQGRQDRPDDDEDGARAGLPVAGADRRGLVLHQHPRQPRRRDPRRRGLARQQDRDQGRRPRRRARLPRRGPRRAHRLLPPARGREGGVGQHRPHRLPRPAHAGQGRLPVPGLDPGGAAGPRARAAGRRGRAPRRGRRPGAARLLLQGAGHPRRTPARARVVPPGAGAARVDRAVTTGVAGARGAPVVPAGLHELTGLFREIGDLKRVHVAGRPGSMADRAFTRAWAALVAGRDPGRVAAAECAAAVAGARLAGLDAAALAVAGLRPDEAHEVRARAIDAVGAALPDDVRRRERA